MIVSGYMNHDEVQNASTNYFGWENTETITVKSLKRELFRCITEDCYSKFGINYFLLKLYERTICCLIQKFRWVRTFGFYCLIWNIYLGISWCRSINHYIIISAVVKIRSCHSLAKRSLMNRLRI